MANDTNTRVIIDVSLNSADAIARADQLGKSIREIKEEQKQLRESGEENSAAYVSNAQSLRLLNAEQRSYVQIANASEGSNNQLRAQLALLTQQYNALGAEERENTVSGKALQVQIRGISDELKKNESAVGDNRRNVGNYRDALEQSTDALENQKQGLSSLTAGMTANFAGFKQFGDGLNGVNAQLKAFKQAQEEARAAQEQYQQAQQIANDATEEASALREQATAIGFRFSAGQATATEVQIANTLATDAQTVATSAQTAATEAQIVATNAATNATKVFKVALASTGIGAIIIVVAALISYFSKFDPLIDKLEQGFAAVGAVVNRVVGFFVDLISGITSFRDLIAKVGAFLANPIKGFKELGNAIADAASAAVELKKAQQDLDDQMILQEVANAKALQQIKELTLQSRNRSLSEKERLALLAQATKLDEDNFKRQKAISDEKTRIALEDLKVNSGVTDAQIANIKRLGIAEAIRLKDSKRVTDEQIAALKDAELENIKNLEEATNREEKRQNQADALREKAIAAEEKRQQKLQQLREKGEEAERARLESAIATNIGTQSARQEELDAIDREIAEKKEKYKAYGATVNQLEKERLARRNQINAEYDLRLQNELRDTLRATQDLQIAQIQNQDDRELMQIAVINQRKLEALDEYINATLERQRLGEQGLTELLAQQQIERDAILSEGRFLIDEKNNAIAEANKQKSIEREQAIADAKEEIRQQEIANQDAALGLVQQIFDKETAIGKAAFLLEKGLAVARIVVQTQSALAANRLAEQAINTKLAFLPFGQIAIIANGIAQQAVRTRLTIAGALSAATVVATAIQGFSQGGVFESDGKGAVLSGYSKTDNTNARLRSGEAVIVAEAARDPRALQALSAINMAYGGRALAPSYAMASGGIAQGGFVSGIGNAVQSSNDLANLVLQTVAMMPKPVVSVVDIISETGKVARNQVNVNL